MHTREDPELQMMLPPRERRVTPPRPVLGLAAIGALLLLLGCQEGGPSDEAVDATVGDAVSADAAAGAPDARTNDAALRPDAAPFSDAAHTADTAAPPDAASPPDDAAEPDPDASPTPDAAFEIDAAARPDAAATDPDASPTPDAAFEIDAAQEPDAARPNLSPPVARAGTDRRATVGATVHLNGSLSDDPDGQHLSFAWRIVEQPLGGDAVLDGDDTPTPQLSGQRAGRYTVELVVDDGVFESAPDTLEIELSSALDHDPLGAAEVAITTRVAATGVEPLGANLTTVAGGTNFAVNNHVKGSGFEPASERRIIRIERVGETDDRTWFSWDTYGGVDTWDTNANGFGNGAVVRFYRLVDANGAPLPYTDGMHDVRGADHVVFLGEATVPFPTVDLPTGGWAPNDVDGEGRVYVDAPLTLAYGDYAMLHLTKTTVPAAEVHPRLHGWWDQDQHYLFLWGDGVRSQLVPHPAPVPAELDEPGQTCLQITADNAQQHHAGQWTYHPFDQHEGQWYSQLTPGASYRVEAWLRQEGLGDDGRVSFAFVGGNSYAAANQVEPWQVTDAWQRFTYDFVAPPYPETGSGAHIAHALRFTGPGTLYVDNFLLYRFDEAHGFAPHGPHVNSIGPLLASFPPTGPKPVVRFYPLQYGNGSIDSMLGNYGEAKFDINSGRFSPFGTATIAQSMRWAYATGEDAASRVVPFLTVSEEYTEIELAALVEYLGVPYDPAVDTPETKPYAHRRFRQRGHGAPWTEDFREILVEWGNETWHQGAGGYGWHGFGVPGWVHHGGVEYGLFARYVLDAVRAQPAWAAHDLGARLRFVLGGNYDARPDSGYGELAIQQARGADYLGHANYVGPKWETGDAGSSVFDDHGVQETLVALETQMRALLDQAAASRELLAAQGLDYRVVAYEGGPSGYWTNDDAPEIDELYGKSLAMGLAALDTWLYASLTGVGHQAYLGFSSGRWWTSHTPPEAGGFRPHPGWLALTLRNRHAPGDTMLAVELEHTPRYRRGEESLPLISAYALRDGPDRVSVVVLSRVLDGVHDGADFGDGVVPTTLHLPFTRRPTRVTLHRLAHPDGTPADPRENNLADERIVLLEDELDPSDYAPDFVIGPPTGGLPGGLPPGAIHVYGFHFAD